MSIILWCEDIQYDIKFGSFVMRDGFCFIGKGAIEIEEKTVILAGKRTPKLYYLLIMIIAATLTFLFSIILWDYIELISVFVPMISFYVLCLVLILLLDRYVSIYMKVKTVTFRKSDINEITRGNKITRKENNITFLAPSKDTGKMKRCIFRADSEEEAKLIESLLRT